jgi:hypothetical protein
MAEGVRCSSEDIFITLLCMSAYIYIFKFKNGGVVELVTLAPLPASFIKQITEEG